VRDKELKLEDGEASHTLGGAGELGTKQREVERMFVSGVVECLRVKR
jgi:hypothetical protein